MKQIINQLTHTKLFILRGANLVPCKLEGRCLTCCLAGKTALSTDCSSANCFALCIHHKVLTVQLISFFFLLNRALHFLQPLHSLFMANEVFAQAVSFSSSSLNTNPHCGTLGLISTCTKLSYRQLFHRMISVTAYQITFMSLIHFVK